MGVPIMYNSYSSSSIMYFSVQVKFVYKQHYNAYKHHYVCYFWLSQFQAIVIVAASPLNILFPLIGNFLGPDWQDRLLGTTSVDTLRASRALDGLLNEPQGQTHILPVIGGASYSTRVPLFSHVCPQITVSNVSRWIQFMFIALRSQR